MFSLLNNRKTIRQYSEKEISDELLSDLLTTACRAANTGNMQTYSIIITRDEANKEKLAPAHFNQPCVRNANVVLTFCADFNRFTKWCEARGAKPGYDNFQSFISSSIDALLVAQQFCTAAEISGLGTCYLGTTTYNAPQIIEALNLPRLVIPIITVTVGYAQKDMPQTDRLPLEAVIHTESYKDYTLEDIDKYYAEKESLPENIQFTKENNKETLAQVFTDVRYKKSDGDYFSKVFIDTLKKQGFAME